MGIGASMRLMVTDAVVAATAGAATLMPRTTRENGMYQQRSDSGSGVALTTLTFAKQSGLSERMSTL